MIRNSPLLIKKWMLNENCWRKRFKAWTYNTRIFVRDSTNPQLKKLKLSCKLSMIKVGSVNSILPVNLKEVILCIPLESRNRRILRKVSASQLKIRQLLLNINQVKMVRSKITYPKKVNTYPKRAITAKIKWV